MGLPFVSIFGAIFSSLSYGSANIVAKKALEGLTLLQTLVIGTAAGSFLLLVLTIFTGDLSIISYILPFAILMGIIEVGLYLAFYKSISVANLTVAISILSTYPVFTLLISGLFLGEIISVIKVILILIIIIGVLLTSIDWRGALQDGLDKKDLVKGLPWILLALAFHVLYFPLLSIYTEQGNWETRIFFAKIVSFIIFCALFAFRFRRKLEKLPERKKIIPTSMLGLLEVLGLVGLSIAFSTSVSQVGVIIALSTTSPLFTAIGAYIFLKERLKPLQYVGFIVTFIGIVGLSIG